jgi:hypothetical protein
MRNIYQDRHSMSRFGLVLLVTSLRAAFAAVLKRTRALCKSCWPF